MHTMRITAQCVADTLPQVGVFGPFVKVVKTVLLHAIFGEKIKSLVSKKSICFCFFLKKKSINNFIIIF